MKTSNYYTKQTLNDELMHYGVMGMHWGVRRYQPYPAAYDGDGKFIGKKALKKQVKADKKAVDEETRTTSILGSALTRARKREDKYKAKGRVNKAKMAEESRKRLEAGYEIANQKLQSMVKDLKKKYGKDNVRDLIYKGDGQGNKVLNERVLKGEDWLTSAISTVGITAGLQLTGIPLVYLSIPMGRAARGAKLERMTYNAVRNGD